MIWSHCGFQGVPPISTFFTSIGGAAGLVWCPAHSKLWLPHEKYETHDERCLQRSDTHVDRASATNRCFTCHPSRDCPAQVLTDRVDPCMGRPWSVNTRAHSACRRARPWDSRHLAGLRRGLSRSAWLFPSWCSCLSRFDCGCNRRWQFHLGLFRSAMVAMVHRLDAGSFFYPQLIVPKLSALILEVLWNCSSCHGRSVAELSVSKLCNFGHFR
jgi:hypothetical protein